MIQGVLLLLLGLVILTAGAESLVRGAATLALRLGIAPLVVGLTVIGFGTSAPELVISATSAFQGKTDISLGNVIGSNICNIALVLGLAAMVKPMKVTSRTVKAEMPISLVLTAGVWGLAYTGERIERWEGVLLIVVFGLFMFYCVKTAKSEVDEVEMETGKPAQWPWFLVLLGIAGLIAGANTFVEGAIMIAKELHIPNRIIGLTVIAIGTSMPELATTVMAAVKGQADLGLGNVIGSGLFNILLVLGVVAVISPIAVSPAVLALDFPVMFGVLLAAMPMAWLGYDINRYEGFALVSMYVAYMWYLVRDTGIPG